jgi:hypothetical protein
LIHAGFLSVGASKSNQSTFFRIQTLFKIVKFDCDRRKISTPIFWNQANRIEKSAVNSAAVSWQRSCLTKPPGPP